MKRRRQQAEWDDDELRRLGAFDDFDDFDDDVSDSEADEFGSDNWDFADGFIVPDGDDVVPDSPDALDLIEPPFEVEQIDVRNILPDRSRRRPPSPPPPRSRRSVRLRRREPSPSPPPPPPRFVDLTTPPRARRSGDDDNDDDDGDDRRLRRLRPRRESTETVLSASSLIPSSSLVPSRVASQSPAEAARVPTDSPVTAVVAVPTQAASGSLRLRVPTQSSAPSQRSPAWQSTRQSRRHR